jgi:integrase
MNREKGRLRASDIPTLGPGRHHDGGGLYLMVGKTGSRSWIFRYFRDGKAHDLGLGSADGVGLRLAREKRLACRTALLNGVHLAEQRLAERTERLLAAARSITFAVAAERYITAKCPEWHDPRLAGQWRQSLADYVFPTIGELPVAAIDTDIVHQLLDAIWLTKTETASRVRGRIEAILDWSATKGYRTGPNPARWRGHLENLLAKPNKVKRVTHHPALPFADIGVLMSELRQVEGLPARALEFLILTASRTDEAREAQWDEFDLTERLWTVPAERMKGKETHRVPLSDAAMRLLEALPRDSQFVFPGLSGAIGPMQMRRVLEGLRPKDVASVHGMRSTFRDWAGETTSSPREVIEMALAHKIKGKAEAAYWRGDAFQKRQALMQDWSTWCAGGAVVLPFPVRAIT